MQHPLATAKRRTGAAIILALVAASVLAATLTRGSGPGPATAASHREAPLIAMDPEADISDFFFFRSYEQGKGDKVVLIMDVIPGEEPSSGPNYFNFDPSVRYTFNVDNDRDGDADDVQFEFRFQNHFRGLTTALGLPVPYFGGVTGVPPITSLDSPGLGLVQTYTVTMIKEGKRTELADDLKAVPSNVGPRTMPNYQALVDQGTYNLAGGIRVFAGQRDDPFYIDLGAVFDSLNLRSPGIDMLSGFNVHTIALELPSWVLTSGNTTRLGAYAATYRRQVQVDDNDAEATWRQVQRLANPLVNELIIGTTDKDRWNALDPDQEELFRGFYRKPRIALAEQLAFGLNTGCVPGLGSPSCSPSPPAPAADLALSNFNRTDLVNVLLKYNPSRFDLSELLRLNLNVAPTPLASQKRLTILAGDPAGWPNGRRPIDDVTDLAVQVVGGPNYIGAGAGDAVNANDLPLPDTFPFLASPWDGRGRVHVNP